MSFRSIVAKKSRSHLIFALGAALGGCGLPSELAVIAALPDAAANNLSGRGPIADAQLPQPHDASPGGDTGAPAEVRSDTGAALPDAGVPLPDAGVALPDAVVPLPDAGSPEVPVSVQLARGLVFYLPLDEGAGAQARDGSPHGNHARLVNPGSDARAVWTQGWRGSALQFAGASFGPLQIDNSTSLGTVTDELTVSFWYRIGDRPDGTFLMRAGSMDRGCIYCIDLVNGRVRFLLNTSLPLTSELRLDGPVPAGRWIHFAVTYSRTANETRIFADGNAVVRGQYALPLLPEGLSPVLIGQGLSGAIDEITLHARALSAEEVRFLALGADPTR
jgi:hypothetical protein